MPGDGYADRAAIGAGLRRLAAESRDQSRSPVAVALRAQEIVGTRWMRDAASSLSCWADLIDPVAHAATECDGETVRRICCRCGETVATATLTEYMRGEMDMPLYCGRCGARLSVGEE